ncbi:hypothetical protein YC2023_006926 [Brassica napus]
MDRPFPGHSNEPKAIAHIRVASEVRIAVDNLLQEEKDKHWGTSILKDEGFNVLATSITNRYLTSFHIIQNIIHLQETKYIVLILRTTKRNLGLHFQSSILQKSNKYINLDLVVELMR